MSAAIGHNNPPEPTPFERAKDRVDSLYEEAHHWLDGSTVDDAETATDIGNLLNLLRKAGKDTDAAHKEDKAPHLEAGRAVDDAYRPLREQLKRATDGCKAALAPWLEKQEAIQHAAAEAARIEAERQFNEAQEAIQAAATLAEREQAESLIKDAGKAEKAARKAEKGKATVSSDMGRAVGLRTTYRPVLTNSTEAFLHYWEFDKPAIEAVLMDLAAKDVRAGKRSIPGFEIKEERSAV